MYVKVPAFSSFFALARQTVRELCTITVQRYSNILTNIGDVDAVHCATSVLDTSIRVDIYIPPHLHELLLEHDEGTLE